MLFGFVCNSFLCVSIAKYDSTCQRLCLTGLFDGSNTFVNSPLSEQQTRQFVESFRIVRGKRQHFFQLSNGLFWRIPEQIKISKIHVCANQLLITAYGASEKSFCF